MTKNDKNKLIGIAATLVFHVAVVVMLFVLCFRTPLPLPGEAGVEVDMGMYADVMSHEVTETPSQDEVEEIIEEVIEEDISTEDDELPAIEEITQQDSVPTEQEKVDTIIEEKPVVNQRAMFKVQKKEQNVEEETEVIGEQGSPNGLKDIDRYEGHGGSGGGPAYDLGGRGAKSISSPSKNFSEEGKVVVDIWVDKEGRVQRAEIGKGTTIANSSMLESAKRAAINSIFNKDDDAADLQKGTITYTFIIRQ